MLSDTFQTQLPRFPREMEAVALRGDRALVVAPHEHWVRFEELCRQLDGVTFEVKPHYVFITAKEE